MIVVEKPEINFLKPEEREDGISAFMRIRNGEDYLEHTIMSVVDDVDEIVCVYNGCLDGTENILRELENKNQKIKAYKYCPVVHAPGTEGFRNSAPDSPNSFSYYSNYAMSKTTKSHLIKLDDDELFLPGIFTGLKRFLRGKDNDSCVGIRGINLFDYDSELYVDLNDPVTAGTDTLFFKYEVGDLFHQTQTNEFFRTNKRITCVIDCFYHTKCCKKDRGLNNYDLKNNEQSRYVSLYLKKFDNLRLIPLEEFDENNIFLDPFSLGFKFITESSKTYNDEFFKKLERSVGGKIERRAHRCA